jgi:hypothetical protein
MEPTPGAGWAPSPPNRREAGAFRVHGGLEVLVLEAVGREALGTPLAPWRLSGGVIWCH